MEASEALFDKTWILITCDNIITIRYGFMHQDHHKTIISKAIQNIRHNNKKEIWIGLSE
ncbi:hypothetical protein ACJX0J_017068, partial [Zea mays]